MNFFLMQIYRSFYFILKSGLYLFRPWFNLKLKLWIQLRNQPPPVFSPLGNPVFIFHAASGEIEYVKSIIRELKEAKAQVFIIVTYSSPSAERLFTNIMPYVDLFIPLPWDQPQPVRRFLTALNPHSIFIARTDLWPELLLQSMQNKIKLYVISYNPNFSLFNRLIIKNFLFHATAVFCVHPNQVAALKKIIAKEITVSAPGDTRFDQVFWRLQQPPRFIVNASETYAVLGSTWPEDEKHLADLIPSIVKLGYKIMWCPHEIGTANINRIEQILSQQKLTFVRLSALAKEIPFQFVTADILLVDQIGYLADLYRNASWAFVGGSFKQKVHSVMEPLCCAIPVIVGPRIQNSPEALMYSQIQMNGLQVVQVVSNTINLLSAIENIKMISSQDFKRLLISHLHRHRNATQKIVQFIVRTTQESLNS